MYFTEQERPGILPCCVGHVTAAQLKHTSLETFIKRCVAYFQNKRTIVDRNDIVLGGADNRFRYVGDIQKLKNLSKRTTESAARNKRRAL